MQIKFVTAMIHNIPPSAIIVRLFANSDNYYSPIVSILQAILTVSVLASTSKLFTFHLFLAKNGT